MTDHLMRPTALALSLLVSAGCSETPTQPETTEVPTATPEFAAATNSWLTKADMFGTTRSSLATATVTNAAGQSVLYAIGGVTEAGGSLSRVQAYNVATNTWTYRAPLPIPLFSTNGAGVIDGKIYVSGGLIQDRHAAHRALYRYDPATNTWTRKRDMPTDTWGGVTGVINNQLYVLTCEREEECYGGDPLPLYRYDPATDQWALLAFSPAQDQPMGAVIGGKLYFTGDPNSSPGPNGRFTVYDPATNQFTAKAPVPTIRVGGAYESAGGRLYLFGGFKRNPDGSRQQVQTTNVYIAATNTWITKAPIPNTHTGLSASRVFVDGKARIEVVGGSRPGNNLQYVP
jgi:N-acetylneuraminic acid mutarotase